MIYKRKMLIVILGEIISPTNCLGIYNEMVRGLNEEIGAIISKSTLLLDLMSCCYEWQNLIDESIRICVGRSPQDPIKLFITMNVVPPAVSVGVYVQEALERDQTIHQISEQHLSIQF